jgi:AraC family transcriptional regulator, positive regulator of tynA and feaB
MAFFFSTQDVRPGERLTYWRDIMGLVPHDFTSSAGESFVGSVRSEMLDDILVSRFECDPCEVHRSAANIGQSDCDDFLLCAQLSGRSVFSQSDRQAVTQGGSFVLVDPRRPYTVTYEGTTTSVSLKLPRRSFEERLGTASMLSVHAMDVCRPLSGLASGFLAMLPSRIELMGNAAATQLAEQTLDLIALAMSAETENSPTLSSHSGMALFRLKAVIEARLSDPALTAAALAGAAGMSVRYANALLSGERTSIERYVRHRRLERSRRALKDLTQAHRRISEIAFAWGFSDLSYFGRHFRSAYGMTPSDYRRAAQERAAAGLHDEEE